MILEFCLAQRANYNFWDLLDRISKIKQKIIDFILKITIIIFRTE